MAASETRYAPNQCPRISVCNNSADLARALTTSCSPPEQITRPQNAILSEFESPRRSCGGRDPDVSRGVAQPGRAPGSGPGGRRFKSSLPDQYFEAHKLHFWFFRHTAADDFVDSAVFPVSPIEFQVGRLAKDWVGVRKGLPPEQPLRQPHVNLGLVKFNQDITRVDAHLRVLERQ